MEKKIEISQLKNYLGTGLKFYYEGETDEDTEKPIEFEIIGISQNGWVEAKGILKTMTDQYHRDDVFLICYRLKDLDKFIPELGFVPLEWFEHTSSIDFMADNPWVKQMFSDGLNPEPDLIPWGVYKKLFEWHFWAFGDEYFEQGLIIDKLKTT